MSEQNLLCAQGMAGIDQRIADQLADHGMAEIMLVELCRSARDIKPDFNLRYGPISRVRSSDRSILS